MTQMTDDGPELELEVRRDGPRVVVNVRGELDASAAPDLETLSERLIADGVRYLELDLSQASFLDSSGLRVILTIRSRIENARGDLTIGNPSAPVARLFEITGLTDQFAIRYSSS